MTAPITKSDATARRLVARARVERRKPEPKCIWCQHRRARPGSQFCREQCEHEHANRNNPVPASGKANHMRGKFDHAGSGQHHGDQYRVPGSERVVARRTEY